ncbi:MAG: hypothetical protein MJ100_04460 [Ruminococcus sp.]|nr:hypothetical protein [Ruminococcus sp.]
MKKRKTALTAAFLYLLTMGGLWMFVNSYTNSYNKLSEEKIVPASLTIEHNRAALTVLNCKIDTDLRNLSPESKLYCGAYIIAPDELRSAAYLISLFLGV